MGKFTRQFPAPDHRITYTKGGMYLAAARVDDARVVIDHKLYWAAVAGAEEGRYLSAIFNSDSFTLAVRGFQARGEHNPRDFDKYVFRIPFPSFDPATDLHAELVATAEAAEEVAAGVELPKVAFQAQRRKIREALGATGLAKTLDTLVARLLASTAPAPGAAPVAGPERAAHGLR